ncbi:MAG TPA: SURF1 family cytochrome oxidase biogenesis protein [Sphingomicrobium sp.]|nr:SURF1 family cytochrome oxidase biogenesis protein [Sphingomicrobium sp.]
MNKRLPLAPTLVVTAAIAVLISLGVWQLKRAVWKERLLARYAAAEKLPPISWPTAPLDARQLPLFRYATGVCLRPVGTRAIAGENRAGESGYVHIVDCATGAEGPGMSVQVGWSKNPNQRVEWAGGPVSGIIVPDRVSRMRLVAASAPPGLEPSAEPSPETASAITPAGHRMYAATWFALAVAALIIYILVLMKRGRTA